jgi:hypothetical protein
MKYVWIDNLYTTRGSLVDQVAEVLGRNDFNVEVFGAKARISNDIFHPGTVIPLADEDDLLGDNYSIIDHGSRDTLAICVDGRILNEDEICAYEEEYYGEE